MYFHLFLPTWYIYAAARQVGFNAREAAYMWPYLKAFLCCEQAPLQSGDF